MHISQRIGIEETITTSTPRFPKPLPLFRLCEAPPLATVLRALRYTATQHTRHTALRQAHPGTITPAEAMSLTGKASATFYRWLKRYYIHPVVKTSHLTLYSRAELLAALSRPPPPRDELAPRRVAKQRVQIWQCHGAS
jgi:hypothetical protein